MRVRRALIRRLADELLQKHQIWQPAVAVEDIVRSRGAHLRITHCDEDISGFLFKTTNQPPVIGINSRHSRTRQRFTIAHECGHLLLHDFDEVHVDRNFFVSMRNRDRNSSTGEKLEEIEANLFAAELLMPKRFLAQDAAKLVMFDMLDEWHLKELADKYEVSPQALTIRLSYLGWLPKE